MTLSELIEELQELAERFGDDVDPEVTICSQPRYPMTNSITGLTSSLDADIDEEDDEDDDELEPTVVLRISDNEGYAPKWMTE